MRRSSVKILNLLIGVGILAAVANAKTGPSRIKRNVAVEVLQDSEDCVHHCWIINSPGNSTTAHDVSKQLDIVKTNQVPSSNRATRQAEPGESFSGTGKVFYDNCQNTRALDSCFKACPESKLQKVAIAENIEGEEYCLPYSGRDVAFADYYFKLHCITDVIKTDPRSANCSYNQTISSATFLNFRHTDEHDRSIIYYNDDRDRNNLECRRVCKRLNDQYKCYKPILIDRCGQDGYDLYVRITKIRVRSQLAILRELGAIDGGVYDCSAASFSDLTKQH